MRPSSLVPTRPGGARLWPRSRRESARASSQQLPPPARSRQPANMLAQAQEPVPPGADSTRTRSAAAKAIVTAAGRHHVWLYHATTADPLGQIEHRECSGHCVGAPGQPDCAYNGVIVPVTSYVAKFEFSATTTSRLKSPMGPATDRFEPKTRSGRNKSGILLGPCHRPMGRCGNGQRLEQIP